jgi:hypothetical protein
VHGRAGAVVQRVREIGEGVLGLGGRNESGITLQRIALQGESGPW